MSGYDTGRFKEGLGVRLAEVEQYALDEVRRLGAAVASLRAENHELKRRLGEFSTGLESGKLQDDETGNVLSQSPYPQRSGPAEYSQSQTAPEQPERLAKSTSEVFVTQTVRKNRHAQLFQHYRDTGCAQRIAKSAAFEYVTLALVILNGLWMAIDLDFNGRPLLESSPLFQVVEITFGVLFTVEIVVRFLAFKRKWMSLFDKWFLFDFLLVLTMIIDTWMISLIILITGAESLDGLGFLSVLRILRLLRITRMVKLCYMLPELETMVSSMLAGIRAVLISGVILLSMTYSFAIVLRQLGSSTEWGQEHFSSVPRSVYTLLIESMLPDNGELLGVIGGDMWYCGIIYGIFLLLSAVTIMNMLVGILCDVISRVSEEETEARNIQNMSDTLKAILKSVDKNYDGMVSKAEFEGILSNGAAIRMLDLAGVDVTTLVGEAEFIFGVQGKSQLPFDEFKEEVLKFRRSNVATVGTIMSTRRVLSQSLDQLGQAMTVLQGCNKQDRHDFHLRTRDLSLQSPAMDTAM